MGVHELEIRYRSLQGRLRIRIVLRRPMVRVDGSGNQKKKSSQRRKTTRQNFHWRLPIGSSCLTGFMICQCAENPKSWGMRVVSFKTVRVFSLIQDRLRVALLLRARIVRTRINLPFLELYVVTIPLPMSYTQP
jgi:hypothetical protein